MLLAKIVAILCAHLHITANSVTEITQSNDGTMGRRGKEDRVGGWKEVAV